MKKKSLILGFPHITGVGLVQGQNKVLSFVNLKGEIHLHSQKTKTTKLFMFPFVRGLIIFYWGLVHFFQFLSLSARFSEVDKDQTTLEDKLSKKLSVTPTSVFISLIIIFSIFFGIFLLSIVPDLIASALPSYLKAIRKNAVVGAVKFALFLILLIALKFFPFMRGFWRNNSALNKCLNAKRANEEQWNIKKIEGYSSNFSTNFFTFISFTFALDFFVLSLIGIRLNVFLEILINIAVILLLPSITYEFLKLFESRRFVISRAISMVLCWLTTLRPTQTELETSLGGFVELEQMILDDKREVLDGENSATFSTSQVLCEVKNALAKNDIEDAGDSEWLVATVLGTTRSQLRLIPTISYSQLEEIRSALRARLDRIPLSKIFGWTEFYGLKFNVDKNVLSPRPETEEVCEEAIKIINSKSLKKCLDLCTGSGAIAVAIAKNTTCKVEACDISKSALKVAVGNAAQNNVKINFIESNMFMGLKKDSKFDIIVSNPPYIASKEIALLEPEVKNNDPILSLDGGVDGLNFYRKIAEVAPTFLKKDGWLVLEIGESQGAQVKKLLSPNFENIKVKKDYSNNDRIVIAKLKGAKNVTKNTKNS